MCPAPGPSSLTMFHHPRSGVEPKFFPLLSEDHSLYCDFQLLPNPSAATKTATSQPCRLQLCNLTGLQRNHNSQVRNSCDCGTMLHAAQSGGLSPASNKEMQSVGTVWTLQPQENTFPVLSPKVGTTSSSYNLFRSKGSTPQATWTPQGQAGGRHRPQFPRESALFTAEG